jgi:protein-tyrosine phosphatase
VIDLHCHILAGIDDGAADIDVSVAMARAFVADGVTVVACTPHILPGLYHNTGPGILAAIDQLRFALTLADVPLQLVAGADVHMAPNLVGGLRSGHLLSLAGTRYVLIEPPHHVMPLRIEDAFFDLLSCGYVPILTHPERLTWITDNYATVVRLAAAGALMQLTGASLTGGFGKSAQYWAEKMLDERLAHILATDSHDMKRRPPALGHARDLVAKRLGGQEAENLVLNRPRGILENASPSDLALPEADVGKLRPETRVGSDGGAGAGLGGRLFRIFG